jgi:hypothetical protein
VEALHIFTSCIASPLGQLPAFSAIDIKEDLPPHAKKVAHAVE